MLKRLRYLFVALVLSVSGALGVAAPAQANGAGVFISEFHYDNAGADTGEFVEVTGPAGTALTGWSLVLYNGSGGVVYGTIALSGTIPAERGGLGAVAFDAPGLQNGAPDGIALVNADQVATQFLSYEGSFAGTIGPALGMTSTDIGVAEGSATSADDSLQLVGSAWTGPIANTRGKLNVASTAIVINEFSASTAGTDVEYVELYAAPGTDVSDLTVLELEGDAGSAIGAVDGAFPATGSTDANGIRLISLAANDLENGTITLVLVRGYTGATSVPADTGDLSGLGTVLDTIAVNDGGTGDQTFGSVALDKNFDGLGTFAPGGASRIPDGKDTDTAADWVRNAFDAAAAPTAGEAFNTPGEPNKAYEAPVGGACTIAPTKIGAVQGAGASSPLVGQTVTVQGVVTGDFQAGGFRGYTLQDAGDGDAATSDGVFVFDPNAAPVDRGDRVAVTGTVSEYASLTEITAATVEVCATGATQPSAASLTLPIADREKYESMAVTFTDPLTIIEMFNYDRYGEVALAPGRQYQPTALYAPGSTGATTLAAANAAERITLDDGRSAQNPDPAIHPDGATFTMSHRFRAGDTLTGVTGVLDYRFDAWRIQPTTDSTYTAVNPRAGVPEVGGDLTVASFNVLNYFTTLNSRGANTAEEFDRQSAKIVAAIKAIDADVVGLIEIENNGTAVNDLVSKLNAATAPGTYAAVETGTIGSDQITTAFIYQPARVATVGQFAVLDSSVDPRFIDTANRPALAQTFRDVTLGDTVTVAVNHLKSKGSDCNALGDPDAGDGQGNCNLTRKAAASALADWLAGDPTGAGASKQLIIGDLNSYQHEDPITALTAAGWTDLDTEANGANTYSYLFDGQLGTLDYALGNPAATAAVTGVAPWHINADEPDLIDYDMSFKADAQDALFAPDAYRASDHDPIIVGLDMADVIAPTGSVTLSPDKITKRAKKPTIVTADVTASDNAGAVTVELLDADGLKVIDRYHFSVPTWRPFESNGTYTVIYRLTDAAGNTTDVSAVFVVDVHPGSVVKPNP